MSEEKPGIGTSVGDLVPPKRKQGRPRKNHALLPLGEKSAIPQKPDGRGRKPRRKKCDLTWPTDSCFIGQQVHGVLDGSFDAGYLLTVRVGDSQTVLRGVVFEPSLSVSISKSNDIAPDVKFSWRNELILPPLHQPVALTSPVVSSPVPQLPAVCSTAVAATSSTPFQSCQPPPVSLTSTGTLQTQSAATQPESGSSKPVVTSHEYTETVALSQPCDSGLQKQVEILSDAQLQTVKSHDGVQGASL